MNTKPLTVFSKYLAYNVGGAEQSMLALLQDRDSHDREINIVSFSNVTSFDSNKKEYEFPSHWKTTLLSPSVDFKRYAHYEYYCNKKLVSGYFENLSANHELYTYSLYSPAAINSFNGNSRFYLRSENDLLVRENYYTGPKGVLKRVYLMSEFPALSCYRKELINALQKSEVIANSNFMANLCHDIYGVQARVEYPLIDSEKLNAGYLRVKNDVDKKGVVFVGDSLVKGVHIARDISLLLPDVQFYFFSRYVHSEVVNSNVTLMPWKKETSDIYKYAKIVIVPSVWNEAYGRVARESYLLGIPTLVSKRGGLPEAVEQRPEYIVNNYSSITDWVEKIKEYL